MKLKNDFRILEFYKNMSDSYKSGVNINNIELMLTEDHEAFENNKQSFINNEFDYKLALVALDFLKAKIYNYEESDLLKETFYDKCIDQKEKFQSVLDDGVSMDNLEAMVNYDLSLFRSNTEDETGENYKEAATKTLNDKKINKLALTLLKKETTNL